MLPQQILKWGQSKNKIREISELAAIRKQEIGKENVFDFSIGNPSIPAPKKVDDTIINLIKNEDSVALHSYTPANGIAPLRKKVSENLKERFNLDVNPDHVYVTCGAAAGLTISLKAVVNPNEEVIINVPFFPEYTVYTIATNATPVLVEPRSDFQLDVDKIEAAITEKTRAIILNTPNNPSGAVYTREVLENLAKVLKKAQEKYNKEIYIISDEPYRELVYEDGTYCCPLEVYENSILCYSYSKSLSLPGERIGYIALNRSMKDADLVFASICGAGRALGFINAPSMMQKVLEECIDEVCNVAAYKHNRDLLCEVLKENGYQFVKPDGAFYLFVKALEDDAVSFCKKALEHELVLVPSDDFGITGYVRVAYCVSESTILNSAKAFKQLYQDYNK